MSISIKPTEKQVSNVPSTSTVKKMQNSENMIGYSTHIPYTRINTHLLKQKIQQ